jgi:hypothetical protein
MKNPITLESLPESVIQKCLYLKRRKKGPVSYLQVVTDLSREEAHELYRQILAKYGTELISRGRGILAKPGVKKLEANLEDISVESGMEEADHFHYNEQTDKYVVYLNSLGKNVVFPGGTIRAIKQAYSNWGKEPDTVNQIARKFRLSRRVVMELTRKMGWTHDSIPLTDEELRTVEEDKVIKDMLRDKEFRIWQSFQKEDWRKTQLDALKWKEFQSQVLNPYENFLNTWQPPAVLPSFDNEKVSARLNNPLHFVCGCFDWQVGSAANRRFLYGGENWSTEKAKAAIADYVLRIKADVEARKNNFEGCTVCLGGDLAHGFRGRTEKGTQLLVDTWRDEQFDALFQSLIYLISHLRAVFPTVDVKVVRGNHEGFDMYPLAVALQAYFRDTLSIRWEIAGSRTLPFKVKNTLILLDHGASDVYEASVPRAGKPRESYIQSLLLRRPELLVGVNSKLFIQGDQHTFQQIEHNDFEFFMFGALPKGDQYADALNLHNRPRQNCLVIDENGVKEVLHYYVK